MKYNKYWKNIIATDHLFQCKWATRCVLSYDKWKQRCKESNTLYRLNWRLYLTRECEKIDARIFEHRRMLPLWCSSHVLSDDEKLKICELNKRTLYKICKKVDKVLLKQHGSVGMHWYSAVCANHTFRFLGGAELGRIRLNDDMECPVCWEPFALMTPIVIRCGHAFCTACASRMWQQPRGAATCPMCRFPIS